MVRNQTDLVGFFTAGNITAVFTNKTIGERLAALIEENSAVYITITRGRYIKPIPSINR